jgi:transposase
MQGKESPEQDTVSKFSAGIDVSKDWLDAHILPSEARKHVSNTRAGIAELKRWLLRVGVECVAIEATGKWHRAVCRSLVASGVPVSVTDAAKVRHFARAQGILEKTDRLDARVLAMFAAVMQPAVRPLPSEALEELQELASARSSAVAHQAALKNQLSSAKVPFLRRQLKRRISELDKHIEALEQEMLARIKADADLLHRYRIVTSIPGIGPATAAVLVACLSELGMVTARQASKLVGVAPLPDRSGKHQGRSLIGKGRAAVRCMLYMAALSASQRNPDLKAFYRRLLTGGKAKKYALIAVARKLVCLANTLVLQNRQWLPHAPQPA